MIRWVAAVVALLTTGCATVQSLRFEQPEFDLTSVRVDGLGLTGGSLTLLIDVDNPNAYDLRTGQIDVAIDFEGARFGEGPDQAHTRRNRRRQRSPVIDERTIAAPNPEPYSVYLRR